MNVRTAGWRIPAVGLAAAAVAGAVAVGGYLGTGGSAAASSTRGSTPPVTSAPAAGAAAGNTVTVDGTGKAAGAPGALDLQLEVQVTANDAAAALSSASSAMTRVQQSLRSSGVKSADLQTSGVSLQPNYDYGNNGGSPRLTGFVADESLLATLRSVSSAGATINAVVRAGGDAVRIDGVQLDLGPNSALMSEARASAFADAKAKAEQYAGLAGRSLGAVLSVTETAPATQPQPYGGLTPAASAAGAAVPVQPGTQSVSVDVQVVWALQ